VYQVYKVEASDTLDSIARKFGITVQELRNINGIGEIYAGGYILVPSQNSSSQNISNQSNSSMYETYLVKSGDNIYAISKEYGIPFETLLRINGLNKDDYIYPGQQLLIPASSSGAYVTLESDTINSLYNKYKNNWESFLSQNQTIYVVPDQLITYK